MSQEFTRWEPCSNGKDVGMMICDEGGWVLLEHVDKRIAQAEADSRRLYEALVKILDQKFSDDPCLCDDHTSDDCCAKTDFYCPACIAGAAIRVYESRGK